MTLRTANILITFYTLAITVAAILWSY